LRSYLIKEKGGEMNKKISAVIILAISLFFCKTSFAETILLKSGKTVEGAITEKTDKYIKVDYLGVPLTYYLDEIESIDGNPVTSASQKISPVQPAPEYKKPAEITGGSSDEEKTIEMILEKSKNARSNIKTFKARITNILGNETTIAEMEADFDNKAFAMTEVKDGKIATRAYLKQGVTYMQVLGRWVKSGEVANLFGNLLDRERWSGLVPKNYKETGFSFMLKAEEAIEGRPCYVLYSTIADKDKAKEILRTSLDKIIPANVIAQLKTTELENTIELFTQKFEGTEWIDKDTFFNIRTLTKTLAKNPQGQVVSKEDETTFYDINKPLDIEMPAEALQAKELATVTSYGETLDRGTEYYKQGRYDEAIIELNKANAIDPNDFEAYGFRGTAYFKKGNLDQAISDLNKAIELNPNYSLAYCNRGFAYVKKGDHDQALFDFNKAIELNPNYADAFVGRGATYARKGNYDQAISDNNKVIEIDPNYAGAYYSRGVAYYFKNDYDKAWIDINKAEWLGFKVDPEFLEALKKASGREN
jgi:tetratricopeptide (TPR) repeat protein